MFYRYGIDITKDKSMFEFINNHFTYFTMNSWNRTKSIANPVKLYNLDLAGDWTVALSFLEAGGYDDISFMIHDWEREHPSYSVYFNGRSGGYLVLGCKDSARSAIPESLDYETYEDYKADMQDYYGSVKANRNELREFVELVRDFDRLCDNIRDFVNDLSQQDFAIVEMQKAVEEFNDHYASDLEMLGLDDLVCDTNGVVDLSGIIYLLSLTEAFLKTADRKSACYKPKFIDDTKVKLETI